MHLALKILAGILVLAILTALTQVGGIVLLLSVGLWPYIRKKVKNKYLITGAKVLSFVLLYSLSTFAILPLAARYYDRVGLPMFENSSLRPCTIWTVILNRNYVTPDLEKAAFNVARKMNNKYPGTVINYLDASFPLGHNFRILPHLSHGDGKKLDVAFHYISRKSGNRINTTPSPIGYGVFESPGENEITHEQLCANEGYWSYKLMPGFDNDHRSYLFDEKRTKELTVFFARDKSIEKIFIEPHLKTRLGLTSEKIRFQGCGAAHHDDHIHVQVK